VIRPCVAKGDHTDPSMVTHRPGFLSSGEDMAFSLEPIFSNGRRFSRRLTLQITRILSNIECRTAGGWFHRSLIAS